MPDGPQRLNPFYYLALGACVLFVVTIFALVAQVFGGRDTPAARLLNDYAGVLIAVEVATTLAISLLALAVDRRSSRNNEEPTERLTRPATDSAMDPIPAADEETA